MRGVPFSLWADYKWIGCRTSSLSRMAFCWKYTHIHTSSLNIVTRLILTGSSLMKYLVEYYIWFFDQEWGQDGWILGMFMDRDGVEVHKFAKKKRGQCPAILTEKLRSIKDLLFGFWGSFSRGTRRVIPSGQDSSILPARVGEYSAQFGSSC